MPGHDALRILVVQPWTADLARIDRALRNVGIAATLTRVDFEAALDAVLVRERFDAAIFDPSTPVVTQETIEACLRRSDRRVPVVVLDAIETLGQRIASLLRRN